MVPRIQRQFLKGTNNFLSMGHDEIRDITPDETVTYAQIVVDY